MLNPMREDRLLRAAEVLEADANNPTGAKFDLYIWGQVEDLNKDVVPEYIPLNCGTVVCAIGTVLLSGVFAEEGFVPKFTSKNFGNNNLLPSYAGKEKWEAVEAFFEIDKYDATYLFSPQDHRSQGREAELAVVAHIRELVANNGRI